MTSFNIDQWLSGAEGTRVVHVVARALYEGTRGKVRNPQPWVTVDGASSYAKDASDFLADLDSARAFTGANPTPGEDD